MPRARGMFMTMSRSGGLALVDGSMRPLFPASQVIRRGIVEGVGQEERAGRLVLVGLVVMGASLDVARLAVVGVLGRLVFGRVRSQGGVGSPRTAQKTAGVAGLLGDRAARKVGIGGSVVFVGGGGGRGVVGVAK